MRPFEQCPVCGGELVEKKVEQLLRGGLHTAVLQVQADVCLHCGEHLLRKRDVRRNVLFSEATVRHFAEIRSKLERQETADFQPLGHSFRVA
jgi:YgiT-type zinc finger domain-containing protein